MNKQYVNEVVSIKVVLAGLWIVLLFLYIYADFFSIYRTGQVEQILSGKMGFMTVTQITLLFSSVLMIIPIAMIAISLLAKAGLNRIVNIIVGFLYLIVNFGNIITDRWYYYILFGVIEIIFALIIIWKAAKWAVKN